MNNKYSQDMEAALDRVTAERDALQQRLTAADELLDSTKAELAWQESDNAELRKRVEVLKGLLHDLRKGDYALISSFWNRIDAALKPAEAYQPTVGERAYNKDPVKGRVIGWEFKSDGEWHAFPRNDKSAEGGGDEN